MLCSSDTWRRESKYAHRAPATVSITCPKMSLQIFPLQARRVKEIAYWKTQTLRMKVRYFAVESTFSPPNEILNKCIPLEKRTE